MAQKPNRMDPLEAAKITAEKVKSDDAALGVTNPVRADLGIGTVNAEQQAAAAQALAAEKLVPEGECAVPAPVAKPALRTDGPTIEEWVGSGHKPEAYPPEGYAEKASMGLRQYKVGSPISPELIKQAMEARKARETPPKKVVYVFLEDARLNVGGGQVATFKKGHALEHDGYGHKGIQRLLEQGAKLERREV